MVKWEWSNRESFDELHQLACPMHGNRTAKEVRFMIQSTPGSQSIRPAKTEMNFYKRYPYKRYPMMRPYIGDNFHAANTPSLLLVGESHYLPEDSSQHLSAEAWYAGSSDILSAREIGWINTAALLKEARAEDFVNKAHRSESRIQNPEFRMRIQK
jgi:hypothetical protein